MRKKIWIFIFMCLTGISIIFLIVAYFSNSIRYYPACITFYSGDQNYKRGGAAIFELIHPKLHLSGAPKNGSFDEYASPSTTVKWNEGTILWVNVCKIEQDSSEWIAVSKEVQKILSKDERIYIRVAMDSRDAKCNRKHDLAYPVSSDISKILNNICN